MSESTGPLKKTPLNATHKELGGKMVDFGGWELPVQFSGILDEHEAVRTKVGATALTRTRRPAHSTARVRVIISRPPLLAAWGPFTLFLLVGETVLIRTEE